jgi:hypothetical protein
MPQYQIPAGSFRYSYWIKPLPAGEGKDLRKVE